MINYLEKYNNLPKDLRDKISAPHVMRAMHELEAKYSVSLAALIMRVMVKDLHMDDLANFLIKNLDMESAKAKELVADLKRRIFSEIANYLDYITTNGDNNTKEETASEKDGYEARFGLNIKTPEAPSDGANRKVGANFYFSIEDEDEVRNHAQDFSQLDRREQIAQQVESKIDEIIGEINVIFSSEDMLRRLKQVLKTYLRGVRDKLDTKQALERDIANGGMGLDEEIAEDILKVVDMINANESKNPGRIIAPKKFSLPEDKMAAVSNGEEIKFGSNSIGHDVDYDFSKLAKRPARLAADREDAMQLKIDSENLDDEEPVDENEDEGDDDVAVETEGAMEEKRVLQPASRVTELIKADREKQLGIKAKGKSMVLDLSVSENKEADEDEEVAAEEPEKEEAVSENAPSTFNPGMMARARNKPTINADYSMMGKPIVSNSGKVKIEDIKKVVKLGGPSEEIQTMSLVDFRRMSRSPKEAVDKIMAIFELLEEEGFNKRMAGIKAWRQCPLNKLYLAIGQESLIKKKDIQKIIEARKKENQEYLSQEEFDAIMELNKKLRY